MNALFEFFGKSVLLPDYLFSERTDTGSLFHYPEDMVNMNVDSYISKLRNDNPDNFYYVCKELNRFEAYMIEDINHFLQRIDDTVLWAYIYCFSTENSATLHSTRTQHDIATFVDILKTMNYENDYGSQELFGYIVMKDGSWYERGEYDGSEWWEHKKCPTEPDI